MRFVFVMDPMDRVTADKDTTYAFMRAAQARGHECLHTLPSEMYFDGDDLFTRARPVTIQAPAPGVHHYALGEDATLRIADTECVFVRKDPPFDVPYLYATLMLETLRGRMLVVNDPRGLRDANEKLYALAFKQHMPRTFVGASRDAIFEFVKKVGGKAVIKPLDGAGGAGVLMVFEGDKNARSIVDLLTQEGRETVMVQEFIERVTEGDKRVLLLEGKLLGAINRVPRGDDIRSNIHAGGRVEPTTVTPEEQKIIDAVAPKCVADGLYFVGLDIVGGKLTEVNVTSPTGIQELSRHVGRDVAADVIIWAEKKSGIFRADLHSMPPA